MSFVAPKRRLWYFILPLVLILCYYLGWFNWLSRLSDLILSPVSGNAWSIVARRLPSRDTQDLIKILTDTTLDRHQLNSLAIENEALRDTLKLTETRQHPTVSAKLIGRDFHDSRLFLINRGRVDGLTPNLAVLNESGSLWGLIKDVKEVSATVMIMTDPRFNLSVYVPEAYAQPVSLTGDHHLSTRLNYVPLESRLTAGQPVLTAGLEPLIPKDILIGPVTAVRESPEALFIEASVQPLATLTEPVIVTVIKPYDAL